MRRRVHVYSQCVVVGWPQTVHDVSAVLHADTSKSFEKKFVPPTIYFIQILSPLFATPRCDPLCVVNSSKVVHMNTKRVGHTNTTKVGTKVGHTNSTEVVHT